MGGIFITLEGGEGTGKSTQGRLLAAKLRELNHKVVLTREPGGTAEGESLRALLVSGDPGRWSAAAEAMLNAAARDSHVRQVIAPALRRGEIVISDRFMDSTRAYQGYAGGCNSALIDELERAAVGGYRPQLTLIFDLDPEMGLVRAKARGTANEDRYERKGLNFHKLLREGFLAIAKAEAWRCKVIDANQSEAEVFAQVWPHVESLFDG